MPTNRAAWITAPRASPLEIKAAPYPAPGLKDVIVRVHCIAINPLEYKIQDVDPPLGGKQIRYPTILGADMAGIVIATGDAVTKSRVGDRLIANVSGLGKASAAFQEYVLVPEQHTTPVPDGIELERAVVLPLACDTAAAGLFMQDRLGLLPEGLRQPNMDRKEILLIWGGSSSVGCCAIQLAEAAGYVVYTTASARNHELCSSVGAAKVFDHRKIDVEDEIVAALRQKHVVGALDCISDAKQTMTACIRILSQIDGAKKLVTVLSPPDTLEKGEIRVEKLSIPAMLGTETYDQVHAFLAEGLADGRLLPKPEANVVGEGLRSIQHGIDMVRKGVSGRKIVVRLISEETS